MAVASCAVRVRRPPTSRFALRREAQGRPGSGQAAAGGHQNAAADGVTFIQGSGNLVAVLLGFQLQQHEHLHDEFARLDRKADGPSQQTRGSSRRFADTAIRKDGHEGDWRVPLREHHLRGGGRSGDSQGLPLHGLPEANRHRIPYRSLQPTGHVQAEDRDAEDLRQDRWRERELSVPTVSARSAEPRSTPPLLILIRQPMGYGSVASTNERYSLHRPVKSGAARRNLGRWTYGRSREQSGSERLSSRSGLPRYGGRWYVPPL